MAFAQMGCMASAHQSPRSRVVRRSLEGGVFPETLPTERAAPRTSDQQYNNRLGTTSRPFRFRLHFIGPPNANFNHCHPALRRSQLYRIFHLGPFGIARPDRPRLGSTGAGSYAIAFVRDLRGPNIPAERLRSSPGDIARLPALHSSSTQKRWVPY